MNHSNAIQVLTNSSAIQLLTNSSAIQLLTNSNAIQLLTNSNAIQLLTETGEEFILTSFTARDKTYDVSCLAKCPLNKILLISAHTLFKLIMNDSKFYRNFLELNTLCHHISYIKTLLLKSIISQTDCLV